MGEADRQGRQEGSLPLHGSLFRAMRRHPFRVAFADRTRPRMSCAEALAAIVLVARRLASFWADQESVGILLPPSVGGALVNHAASLSGRVSVNLNYTTGRLGLEAAARRAGLRTVVTSRQFMEKAGLELPGGLKILWLEDAMSAVGRLERIWAFMLGSFAPVRWLERRFARRRVEIDDPVTVIFTSGSTDAPKGVVLSHLNIGSNSRAVAEVLPLLRHDRLLGILPFFHAFGYTALWIAVSQGVGIVFHPTPLEPTVIGDLVQRYQVTLLIATPTFLQLYVRRCMPEQFRSLRLVITGAEKLPEHLAQAFEDRFGVRPVEGYGTTECSPVISLNVAGTPAPGKAQRRARRGTVGKPLPGVAVKIVDPGTFEPLPIGNQGLLLVRGPNVMQGYLGRDDLTASVMRDGWYITGDIAVVDEDGFLEITDRLSRFSKIGGEMVPHRQVEEALQRALGSEAQVFAVTSVPDVRRGETLVVLHTIPELDTARLLERAAADGLPNLYLPRSDHFVRVESLPLLATGKLDLREVRRLALEGLGKKRA
jgi:acyl-[acyl-carrier-protein]-phospholipid O-acyltransferase/long-chain-fatty-acid--[acyl-carrier-protein] ligase